MTSSASPRRRFTTPAGGITTREVGAITGEVEVWLDGETVRIAYVGAEEAYTVTGRAAGRDLADVVEALAADPGVDADGNPRASHL